MFDLKTFTILHTLVSLVALVTGLVLLLDLGSGRSKPKLALTYLVSSVATSVSGFGFPFTHFLPSHAVGVLSLIALAIAIFALYRPRHLPATYAISVTVSVYFLAFVGTVQAFLKIPALHALAPTQNSPVFAVAQLVVLAAFVVMGFKAVRGLRRSHPVAI